MCQPHAGWVSVGFNNSPSLLVVYLTCYIFIGKYLWNDCFPSLLGFVLIFARSLSLFVAIVHFCRVFQVVCRTVHRCTCTFIRIFMGHNRFLKWWFFLSLFLILCSQRESVYVCVSCWSHSYVGREYFPVEFRSMLTVRFSRLSSFFFLGEIWISWLDLCRVLTLWCVVRTFGAAGEWEKKQQQQQQQHRETRDSSFLF